MRLPETIILSNKDPSSDKNLITIGHAMSPVVSTLRPKRNSKGESGFPLKKELKLGNRFYTAR